MLLFDQDQLALFNYMRKPIVTMTQNSYNQTQNPSIPEFNILSIEKSEIQKAFEAKLSYQKLKYKSNPLEIEKRLIQCIDPRAL